MSGVDDFNTNSGDREAGAYAGGAAGASASQSAYSEVPGTGPAAGAAAGAAGAQGYGGQTYGGPGGYGPGYTAYGAVPPTVPPPPGTPNPGLATLLGFVPGVGAMYNGQFAKGLAHILIFSVFVSLANHVNEIFGMLVAGWYFYMVFDAYQTARAHRDGLQPPDPFGLNNIGERFGLTQAPNWADFKARPMPGAQAADAAAAPGAAAGSGSVPPYGAPYADTPSQRYAEAMGPATPYEAPESRYGAGPQGAVYPEAQTAYATGGNPYAGAGAQFVGAQPAGAYPPYPGGPLPPGVPPFSPVFDPAARTRSGIPNGAIWLIGLGVLALVGSLSHEAYWTGRYFAGGFLIVLGGALLFQRVMSARNVYPAHTPAASWHLLRTAKGSVALILIGILTLVAMLTTGNWNHLWPYLLIFLGVYQVVERVAYNRMLAAGPAGAGVGGATAGSAGGPAEETTRSDSGMPSIRPRDEEGR